MAHINVLPILRDTHVALGILSSCVICQPSYLAQMIPPLSSFLSLLVGFDRSYVGMWGHYGSKIVRIFSWPGPLVMHYARLPISFSGIGLLSMEDCDPFAFLRNWVLMVSYLCSRFRIFDRPILEDYVS